MRDASIAQEHAADLAFEDRALQGVSRTFALTIPQLPGTLARVVGNGYLLCRIADTIEDEPDLSASRKREFAERFTRVLAGEEAPQAFTEDLYPLLSGHTLASERELICNVPRVIRLTHGFDPLQRVALERCVRIMSRGMAEFQEGATLAGLPDLAALDRYCYHVAGVVGEMLTELFCAYSSKISARRGELMELAVSFGQGLQMTNILKDMWEDRARGACWLPRDLFARAGIDLAELTPGRDGAAFRACLTELVGVTRLHLGHALDYTLLIPPEETGIRRFCLWAMGMAVLTLRKIHRHPDFVRGTQVKISRRSVRATIALSNLCVRRDSTLRWIFAGFTHGLPRAPQQGRVVSI